MACKEDRVKGQKTAHSSCFLGKGAGGSFEYDLFDEQGWRDFLVVTGRPAHARALYTVGIPVEVYLCGPELLGPGFSPKGWRKGNY